MSRINDAVVVAQTGRRLPLHHPLCVYDATAVAVPRGTFDTAQEYRIGVMLAASIYLSDHEAETANGNLFAMLLKNVRAQIVEHVFGEFRLPMIAIERALYERDFERATRALQALRDQMFTLSPSVDEGKGE